MLIYKERVFSHIENWISGSLLADRKDNLLCIVTGGIDSCVTAALCCKLNISKKVIMIFMGFKEKEEAIFENWIINNIQSNTKYQIIKPEHVDLKLPGLDNVDSKSSLSLTYLDLYARRYNALTVGNINKSEYDLVKLFKRRIDTSYDIYPIIDLFRSEVVELGNHLKLPEEILQSKSITEESFGYSFDELEWLVRENQNLGIVSAIKDPEASRSKYWALYNSRNKAMINEVYKMNKMNSTKNIPNDRKCQMRTSMPGLVK